MQPTIAVVLAGLVFAAANASAARLSAPASALNVCLVLAPALAVGGRVEAAILAEMNAIWRPYGVAVRRTHEDSPSCDRLIAVRSDAEARPEDVSSDTALAWVPFVEGRARRVVFLRLRRARVLVDSLSPGTRPEAFTDWLVARLVGRSLAHELGHVLLNSTHHTLSGLMRLRYRAIDVLRDPPSAYTLDDEQRERLYSNLNGG